MAGIWDKIMNPGKVRQEEFAAKKSFINPFQKEMGETMLQEGAEGEIDWEGTPGLQMLQRMYEAKRRGQSPFGPMEKKEGKKEKTVRMGKSGFEPVPTKEVAQKRKDQVFKKIQEKRDAGEPLSTAEANYEKKYLGISDAKTAPTSGKDWDDTLKVAKEIAMSDKIKTKSDAMVGEGRSSLEIEGEIEMMKTVPMTFDEGITGLQKALEFRYPNMDPEKISEIVSKYAKDNQSKWVDDLGITLPPEITKPQQAYKFLIESGVEPEAAKKWIVERSK